MWELICIRWSLLPCKREFILLFHLIYYRPAEPNFNGHPSVRHYAKWLSQVYKINRTKLKAFWQQRLPLQQFKCLFSKAKPQLFWDYFYFSLLPNLPKTQQETRFKRCWSKQSKHCSSYIIGKQISTVQHFPYLLSLHYPRCFRLLIPLEKN